MDLILVRFRYTFSLYYLEFEFGVLDLDLRQASERIRFVKYTRKEKFEERSKRRATKIFYHKWPCRSTFDKHNIAIALYINAYIYMYIYIHIWVYIYTIYLLWAGSPVNTYLETLTRYIVTFHELRQAAVPRRLPYLLIVATIVDLEYNVLEAELLRIVVAIHACEPGFARRRRVASPRMRFALDQGAQRFLARRLRWPRMLRAEGGGVIRDGVVLQRIGDVMAQHRADVIHQALAGHGLRLIASLRRIDVRKVVRIQILLKYSDFIHRISRFNRWGFPLTCMMSPRL